MNDDKIIEAIKKGDEATIDYVITKYSKLMWSIASTILKNVATTQDVEECVADVFVYLWQNPGKYDAQRGKIKVWLSIVARSLAIDKYRQISKRNDVPLDDAPFIVQLGVEDGVLDEEAKHMLITTIKALDEPDQEILIRRYYYDQKPKEIAVALDMPVKHVENHLYRTKLKLRNMLANQEWRSVSELI